MNGKEVVVARKSVRDLLNTILISIKDAHHHAGRICVFKLNIRVKRRIDEHDFGRRTAGLDTFQTRSLKCEV